MLGGFKQVGAENDAGVQKAADFALGELSSKEGGALKLDRVVSAERQVVAGTNYRLKLATTNAGGARATYSVVVYERLPHEGSALSLTSYNKEAGEVN